ncbi:MAG: hypothetical protein LBR80_04880 [Deltaproteobacteria bacterium]|jgi:transposase|nr:hypothetical protein [Deltaproteobacteria bacterium]
MHDIIQGGKEVVSAERNLFNKEIGRDERDKAVANAGKFVMISSGEYSVKEAVKLYSSTEIAERVFGLIDNFAEGLPFRDFNDDTIRGIMLVSFIADVVYSTISHRLSGTRFSARAAIVKMGYLHMKSYGHESVLENLTEDQKKIFKHLHLERPFVLESGNRSAKYQVPANSSYG